MLAHRAAALRHLLPATIVGHLWWSAGLALWVLALVAGGRTLRVHAPAGLPRPVDPATHVELLSRAARRAVSDAERCARDLRELAVRHPGAVARALELEPATLARAGAGGVPALAVRTISSREGAARASAEAVERAWSEGPAHARADEVAEHAARAHATADGLCLAREAASAATLAAPSLRRDDLAGALPFAQ